MLFGWWHEIAAPRGPQVYGHALIIGEHGRRGAQLGTHIGNRGLASGTDGARPGPMYSTGIGAARNCQLPRDIENDVFRSCPAAELAGEVHGNMRGVEDFPGQPGHDLDRICPTHHGAGPQTASVGRMRVCPDNQRTGKAYCSSTT